MAGAVRKRLAGMLAELGVVADPDDLWCQEGGNRQRDGARWGCHAVRADGSRVVLHCWETMAQCVRNGITISGDGWDAEVHAREGAVK